MDEIVFMHESYLKLRDAIVVWVRKNLSGAAWYYRPSPLANSAAWIVPHLVVFEQIKVHDRITGHGFPPLASAELVERYKPGAAGYAMPEAELMSLEGALGAIARARELTERFFALLHGADPTVAGVDRGLVFERYLLNFTHDTEHYGQLKYLSGTWDRIDRQRGG